MFWQDHVPAETQTWLLESDSPSVRYLALRDLLDRPPDDAERYEAHLQAHAQGAIPAILANMNDEGYWVEPGAGYNPKYKSTVWSIMMLAQLGASAALDERIGRACGYLLGFSLTPNGQFTTSGAPSTTADCLQGNLCAAMIDLGIDDARLEKAFEWMARSVTGEGIAPATNRHAELRYYAGKCGPLFVCGANNKLACAWGAVKVMLAFSKLPETQRTPLINRAIQAGVDFLFSTDPAAADYPTGYADKPSGNWWKFGFPVFYVTDLLQNVEALVSLGYKDDPRLTNALNMNREKQDVHGRWSLDYNYAGKTWLDFGRPKQPNQWVTLRALRVLKAAA